MRQSNSLSCMKYQISITGYIGSWTKFMVRDILNNNKGKHVDVAIDSPGGAVSAGLAICQMFKDHGDVTVDFQAGFSASAATICAMVSGRWRSRRALATAGRDLFTDLAVSSCVRP